MKKRKIFHLNIIISAIIIIIIGQVLNAILSISSFENIYRSSLISRYQIIANEIKREIETSVNFGKPLDNFKGIYSILDNKMSMEENVENIFITDPGGAVLYCTDKTYENNPIALKPVPEFKENPNIEANEHYKSQVNNYEGYYYISIPIYRNEEGLKGIAIIRFNDEIINDKIYQAINFNFNYIAITLSIAGVFLIVLHILVNIFYKGDDSKHKLSLNTRNLIVVVLSLIIAQSSYTYFNNNYFKNLNEELVKTNITKLSNLIESDIETVLDKGGLPINRLTKIEILFQEILENIAICREIRLTDKDGYTQYLADEKHISSIANEDFKPEKVDLTADETTFIRELDVEGETEGYLILYANSKYLDNVSFDLLLDSLTVIAVSLIFSFQLLIFVSLLVKPKNKKDVIEKVDLEDIKNKDDPERKYKILRIAAFIFFLAEFIPLSFLPLFIQKLYEANPIQIFTLSKETILSLPIAIYMLGVSISALVTGLVAERFSIRNVFFVNIGFLVAGLILSAFSTTVIELMIFRFLSGIGYGGIIISGVNLIIENTNIKDRTTGFGYWFVGLSSANICAVPIGGVIANRLGFPVAMLIAGFFGILLFLFVFFFVKSKKKTSEEKSALTKFKLKDLFTLFKNRSLVALLLLVSIPAQITFIGFFSYVFPLYMNSLGISQSNIGRLLTIYGLMLLFSSIAGKLADRFKKDRLFIIVGNLILGLTLVTFYFTEGVIMLILAIIAIGIADVLVNSSKGSYITLSDEAKRVGETKLTSIFLTFEKIGTIVAPIIAGILIATLNYSRSIVVIGAVTIIGIVLFGLLSKNLRH